MGKFPWLTTLCLLITMGMARADDAVDKSARMFSGLPLDMALKQVRGNGKRMFATFEDPNCIYCKRLAMDVMSMNDVTIYTFLHPILSADSREKAKAIWCSSDREKSWTNWMIYGLTPAPAPATCDGSPIDRVAALAKKLEIRGTPTIFLADGERISGAIPIMMLEMAISSPKVLTFQLEQHASPISAGNSPRTSQTIAPR